jgi:hypothetical protein
MGHTNWKGFHWQVNTDRKEALKVTGGTFGEVGGKKELLQAKVQVLANGNFQLSFGPEAGPTLVYELATRKLQISVAGTVLSYGSTWQVKHLKPFLFHLREKRWYGFHWLVNTSDKKVINVTESSYGDLGGQEVLPVKLEVVPRNPTR